ncbi:hypothetical protein [Kitasatospora cineracea]|uniref:hypothetical protein n=1 Tax=Kitasatospora cineracea TaxID=88074 RepID=UPI0037AE7A73
MAERDYRNEVHQHLKLLAEGAITPGTAADWASTVMREGEDIDFDGLTWDGLDQLTGADLLEAPASCCTPPRISATGSAGSSGGMPDRQPTALRDVSSPVCD